MNGVSFSGGLPISSEDVMLIDIDSGYLGSTLDASLRPQARRQVQGGRRSRHRRGLLGVVREAGQGVHELGTPLLIHLLL